MQGEGGTPEALAPLPPRDARAVAQARARQEDAPRMALRLLEGVVRRNPGSAEAWREIAMALAGNRESVRARAAIDRWEAFDPEDVMVCYYRALLSYSETDFEEALLWAEGALQDMPGDFAMLWVRAEYFRYMGVSGYESAQEECRSADPERFDEHMRADRALRVYGAPEMQIAFERLLQTSSLVRQGDIARARRLAALSAAKIAPGTALNDLRVEILERLRREERKRGTAAAGRAPVPARPVRPGRGWW